MFYLRHLFQVLKQYPVRGVLFFTLTSLLFFSAGHRQKIATMIGSQQAVQVFNPYFHALVSTQHNVDWVARKLRELPGVERVEVLPKEELSKQVKELLTGMDGEVLNAIGEMNFAGLKVVAKPELEERSIALLKEYLGRLTTAQVTIGATMVPPKTKENVAFSWQRWSAEIAIAVIFLAWLFSIFTLIQPLRRSAYLMEQFQRRRGVAMKTWISAATLAILGGTISAFAWQPPELVPVAICLIAAMSSVVFHTGRVSWKG